MVESNYSLTDPFSKNMALFYNKITVTHPEQATYLTEYGYEPLRKFLRPLIKEDTKEFLGFEISKKDEPAYVMAKKELNLF